MLSFTHQFRPTRVVFGEGSRSQLPAEVERLGMSRPLILSTAGQRQLASAVESLLEGRRAGVFAGAVMHTPVDVTERALNVLRECEGDGLIAIGGGSTTGLGKALALRTDLPQIVLPTTYAGSEMTPVVGQTEDGVKTTQSSPKILPETVIYDVELTLTLPPRVSATSGVNAIAHACEALYARDGNPVISLMAEEAIAALARSLPQIVDDQAARGARTDALYGAWLCGTCLGAVGSALHHKLCHVLGGAFDLPHAETHAIVLPHALAYNAPAATEAMTRIARALAAPDVQSGLSLLYGRLGLTRSLRDLGMPEAGIDRAADLTMSNPYWNPRPLERASIRELIRRAWSGEPARSDP